MSADEFENKVRELNMSKKDFAKLVKLSYSAIISWREKENIPAWVDEFIKYYEKSLILDRIFKDIEKYKNV